MSPLDVPIALALIGASALVVAAAAIHKSYTRSIRNNRASTPRPPAPHRRCWSTGCIYPATVMVIRKTGPGTCEVLDVCKGCGDKGIAYKWWLPLGWDDQVPFWPTDRAERAS